MELGRVPMGKRLVPPLMREPSELLVVGEAAVIEPVAVKEEVRRRNYDPDTLDVGFRNKLFLFAAVVAAGSVVAVVDDAGDDLWSQRRFPWQPLLFLAAKRGPRDSGVETA